MEIRPHSNNGFTLIELSIVLVIIGLIVGGILTGQSLIRSAELRSIVTDVERYTTAVATFQSKYNCLPGDCPRAEALFGVNANGCPNGDSVTGTCNGNGDGNIDYNVLTNPSYPYEAFRVWQQMSQAGLVSGTFAGIDPSFHAVINTNVPSSSHIAGVGYALGYLNIGGNINPYWNMKDTGLTNRIVVARECNGQFLCGAFATAVESYGIDVKYDDGNPASGRMTALKDGYSSPDGTALGSCVYSTTPNTTLAADTHYYLNGTGQFCMWVFRLGL